MNDDLDLLLSEDQDHSQPWTKILHKRPAMASVHPANNAKTDGYTTATAEDEHHRQILALNSSENGGSEGGKLANARHQSRNGGVAQQRSESLGSTISAIAGLQQPNQRLCIQPEMNNNNNNNIGMVNGKQQMNGSVPNTASTPTVPGSEKVCFLSAAVVAISPRLRSPMSSSTSPLLLGGGGTTASRRRHNGGKGINRSSGGDTSDSETPLLLQQQSPNADEKMEEEIEKGKNIVDDDDDENGYAHGGHQRTEHFEDLLARESNYAPFDTHLGYYGTHPADKLKLELDNGGDQTAVGRLLLSVRRTRHELKDDFGSILLLLLLYLLQGVPLGLIAAIPLILQAKEITYAEQAVFSFAYWPFSMKLLWAPIVDSIYFRRIGRRKSWMVPCQYLIGLFLLVISYHVEEILGTQDKGGNKVAPNVYFLVCVFLPLNFLAATQDIAVDGWALTMLSRKNVGYASTCNVVGQTLGFFLGNVVFLTLQSKEFANKWLRSVPADKGLVEFDGKKFCLFVCLI
uniref:Acetyl-coenzyme A transporter 1 n=1 Tax=Globodera rostochiensis TaxID=31243 RepID=A0A914HFV6_GLORO